METGCAGRLRDRNMRFRDHVTYKPGHVRVSKHLYTEGLATARVTQILFFSFKRDRKSISGRSLSMDLITHVCSAGIDQDWSRERLLIVGGPGGRRTPPFMIDRITFLLHLVDVWAIAQEKSRSITSIHVH